MTTTEISARGTVEDIGVALRAARPAWSAAVEIGRDGDLALREHKSVVIEREGAAAQLMKLVTLEFPKDPADPVRVEDMGARILYRAEPSANFDGTLSLDSARALVAVLQRAIGTADHPPASAGTESGIGTVEGITLARKFAEFAASEGWAISEGRMVEALAHAEPIRDARPIRRPVQVTPQLADIEN